MNLKTTVNSAGLILTILGVYIVFVNSPVNFHTISGGTSDESNRKKSVNKKNFWLEIGVWTVMSGGALQLWSNYIN